MLFRATRIQWDTTDDVNEMTSEELNLPEADIVDVDDEDAVIDALSDRHGFCIRGASIEVAPKYMVHGWGPDDPGSYDDFETLDAVREYLKDQIEYYDGCQNAHSDYRRFNCIGFTLADIGCTCSKDHAPFPQWSEWPIVPLKKFTVDLSRMESAQIEVEAKDEFDASAKVQHMLNFEDCSHIEWERLRKSEVIDDVNESEPF